jgi:hypothetical protein
MSDRIARHATPKTRLQGQVLELPALDTAREAILPGTRVKLIGGVVRL